MTSKDFVYWMQGMFELTDVTTLNEKQVNLIKNHIKLVFLYDIDPSYSDDPAVQQLLKNVHAGKKPMDGISKDITKVDKKTNKYQEMDDKIRC